MSHVEPFRDIYSKTFKSIPKASAVHPPSPYLNLRFHTHTDRQTRHKHLCEACGTRAFGYLCTQNCSLTQKNLFFLDQSEVFLSLMSESAVNQFYTCQSDVSKKKPFSPSCGWHDGNLFANFQIFPEFCLPQSFFPFFFGTKYLHLTILVRWKSTTEQC